MRAPETVPVARTDRVSDVLARDEHLVEIFVRHAAHFAKLRNPTMRRVMARLVTVDQAARIAGVPVHALLRDLNDALHLTPESGDLAGADRDPRVGVDDEHDLRPDALAVIELDLREDMRAGREPFSRIMSAVAALGEAEALVLRTIFEPVPLFALLAKRGFAHESARHADDDWIVSFWRARHDLAAAAAVEPPAEGGLPGAPERPTVRLDVRGLEPPEPLVRTLAALDALPNGHQLVHVNVRVPQLLLPMLAERGLACEIDESHADQVLVRIWRPERPDGQASPISPRRAPAPVSSSTSGESRMSLQPIELDVRVIPPRDKHPTIFRTFDTLATGQSLVLLNDHDPKPLRYQLAAERPDSFDWEYEAQGPDLWRVRISRR